MCGCCWFWKTFSSQTFSSSLLLGEHLPTQQQLKEEDRGPWKTFSYSSSSHILRRCVSESDWTHSRATKLCREGLF
jgi:hypothetical protein